MNKSNEFYLNTSCKTSAGFCEYDVVVNINTTAIIRGVVRNYNGDLVSNTVVEVIEINKYNKQPNILGFVVTDKNGEYAISIEIDKYSIYEFKIYDGVI